MRLIDRQNRLLKKIKAARFVFVCGNGGSAANAEHFAEDIFSKGIKAICLSSNMSLVTMIGNDFGYDEIFGRQLEVYAIRNDLLITISCSGTSPNIVEAIRVAKEKGMDTFQFETFGKNKDYGALEDRHSQLIHKIKDLL